MTARRFLVLGAGEGWHADQLRAAAERKQVGLVFSTYETLAASIGDSTEWRADTNLVNAFDAILTRTMPRGSFEQVTFRLAVLHEQVRDGGCVVNPPRALELAIDKFATLARIRRLGYAVPETRVVQSRREAMRAFDELGGDCVIKPIFGGEGKGVLRVSHRELAWTTFSTLEQINAVLYVQRFVPPGGSDTRLLVVGDDLFAVRRTSTADFRTNVSGGADVTLAEVTPWHRDAAVRIARELGLRFGSVDWIDGDDGVPRCVEVNGIPGWRGAQQVLTVNLAERIVDLLIRDSQDSRRGAQPNAA